MSHSADVVVVGAGPAGAVAARTLASTGLSTLIVDRAAFPRNKPCGGGISTRVLIRFPWLDGALADIDVHRIGRLHLEGPAGAELDLDSSSPTVLLVRRWDFDHALVRAAVAAGARVESGFEVAQVSSDAAGVTVQSRDGRRVSAPHIVAADGVHSVLAKRLGVNPRWPRNQIAIDMMEETPLSTLSADRPDVLWIAYAYEGLDGYAYVFPKIEHVNVGIGCLLSHFDEAVADQPYAIQERFVASLVDRGVLRGSSDRRHFTPFLIPIGGPLRRAWHERVLFVGDAGGFVNAITAEGIYYAMVSGELAGLAIAKAIGAGAHHSAGPAYDRSWRSEIGSELSDAVLVQRYFFSNHVRVTRAIQAAVRLTGVTDVILEYVRGETSYASLRRRMLLRFPLSVLRMAREQFLARAKRAS